jgi:hypothetical protein
MKYIFSAVGLCVLETDHLKCCLTGHKEKSIMYRRPNVARLSADFIEVFDVHLHQEKIIKYRENGDAR